MPDAIKVLALNEELQTSHKLIVAGFGALQEVDMGNTFYHLPHQLIASGLERLMKCYLALVIQGKTGAFPSQGEMKKQSHDVDKLLNTVVNEHYGGVGRPLLAQERQFLEQDPTLKNCVKTLALFGLQGRYYNLDVIAGVKRELLDPKSEWEDLEQSVHDPTPYLEDAERLHRDYYPAVNSKLIAVLERMVRAIALQFTIGDHPDPDGNLGSLSVVFSDFRNLRDEELGTRDYRRSVEILKQDTYNWIRRSEQQIVNGRHPTKVIHQGGFEGDWPFRANKVIVECRGKLCAIVNVEGYAFALNGLASGHFKLPGPHAAGVAILGKSLSPFTDIALSLGEGFDSELKSLSEAAGELGRALVKRVLIESPRTKKRKG